MTFTNYKQILLCKSPLRITDGPTITQLVGSQLVSKLEFSRLGRLQETPQFVTFTQTNPAKIFEFQDEPYQDSEVDKKKGGQTFGLREQFPAFITKVALVKEYRREKLLYIEADLSHPKAWSLNINTPGVPSDPRHLDKLRIQMVYSPRIRKGIFDVSIVFQSGQQENLQTLIDQHGKEIIKEFVTISNLLGHYRKWYDK